MKNIMLKHGQLILDIEKAEVHMFLGTNTEKDAWTWLIYSPKGGIELSNEEEDEVTIFRPMFSDKLIKKEDLKKDRFMLYDEVPADGKIMYESALRGQMMQLNGLISEYLKALNVLKNEVEV